MSKYGEPWRVGARTGGWDAIFSKDGSQLLDVSYNDTKYADRAVDAVNEFAGIDKPAEYLAAVRELREAVGKAVQSHTELLQHPNSVDFETEHAQAITWAEDALARLDELERTKDESLT